MPDTLTKSVNAKKKNMKHEHNTGKQKRDEQKSRANRMPTGKNLHFETKQKILKRLRSFFYDFFFFVYPIPFKTVLFLSFFLFVFSSP